MVIVYFSYNSNETRIDFTNTKKHAQKHDGFCVDAHKRAPSTELRNKYSLAR